MKKNLSYMCSLLPRLIILAILLTPPSAFAQATPAATPAATTPSSATGSFIPLNPIGNVITTGTAPSLPNFFNGLYKICIGAAATIAVLQIMRAGFMFMVNKGSVSHNEEAKSIISNSILGLVLVLSPAIVFGIINPKILNLSLDVSGLQPAVLTASSSPAATASTTNPSGTQSYLLAYYFTKQNTSTNYSCYVQSVVLYPSASTCSTAMTIAPSVIGTASTGTTQSSIQFVKSCEATTVTSYTLPAPNNLPLCP